MGAEDSAAQGGSTVDTAWRAGWTDRPEADSADQGRRAAGEAARVAGVEVPGMVVVAAAWLVGLSVAMAGRPEAALWGEEGGACLVEA